MGKAIDYETYFYYWALHNAQLLKVSSQVGWALPNLFIGNL